MVLFHIEQLQKDFVDNFVDTVVEDNVLVVFADDFDVEETFEASKIDNQQRGLKMEAI